MRHLKRIRGERKDKEEREKRGKTCHTKEKRERREEMRGESSPHGVGEGKNATCIDEAIKIYIVLPVEAGFESPHKKGILLREKERGLGNDLIV